MFDWNRITIPNEEIRIFSPILAKNLQLYSNICDMFRLCEISFHLRQKIMQVAYEIKASNKQS